MVKKAIIPVAGKETRLRPITNVISKRIIRVGKKLAITHYLNFLKHGELRLV